MPPTHCVRLAQQDFTAHASAQYAERSSAIRYRRTCAGGWSRSEWPSPRRSYDRQTTAECSILKSACRLGRPRRDDDFSVASSETSGTRVF